MIKKFTVTKKIQLNDDVFEIHYYSENKIEMVPGQFITFILPKIWGRAYSILEQKWNNTILIIKKVKKENGWRWWSIFLCDANVWDEFNWVGPAGHFVLKNSDNNKLFMGTWTWLVPLYNQIITWLERWDKSEYILVFGSRKKEDLFYLQNFENLEKKYSNFKYIIYLSREETELSKKWYVTDFLKNNIKKIDEFYICWMPNMINSSLEILKEKWINDKSIFFEKY